MSKVIDFLDDIQGKQLTIPFLQVQHLKESIATYKPDPHGTQANLTSIIMGGQDHCGFLHKMVQIL